MDDIKPTVHERQGSGPGGPPPGPWDVTVYVCLHSETPGDFTVRSYLQTKPGSNDLMFSNNGRPGFNVRFELTDETGLDYRFPAPPKDCDAIWSELGSTGCPASPGSWTIFEKTGIVVSNHGTVLTAFNRNPSPAQGDFRYTLNVTKDGGATYLPLDPGGCNQNGSSRW